MLSPKNWKRTSVELLLAVAVAPLVYVFARAWLVNPWPGGDASPFVLNWWAGLCALAVANVALWFVAYRAFLLRRRGLPAGRRWHLVLSAIYVLGCAQRSIWPKVDVQRFVLADHWLSSILVGRTIATFAEVAFAAQWALLLNEYSREAGFRFGRWVSWVIVPLLVSAQCCCWYSVVTTSFLGHTCEESLWTLTAALLTVSCAYLWVQSASARGFLGTIVAFGLCYVLYMSTVDVPMYVTRWQADELAHRAYLSWADGLADLTHRWVVTYRWSDWASEISWLSLYFSLAVWASIGCAHVPRYARLPK
jgi:hypothetical protein